jgi:hypothetical protein
VAERLLFKLADRAAEDASEGAEVANAPDHWMSGDVLYELLTASPIWGPEDAPHSSAGQGWTICGPDGSAKPTLAQQYGKVRLGLPGWSPTMLGLEVRPLRADQSVLYLAADRPQQILEGLQRGLDLGYRSELGQRLEIHQWGGHRWALSRSPAMPTPSAASIASRRLRSLRARIDDLKCKRYGAGWLYH